MMNEHVVIVGLGLCIYGLIFQGRSGAVAGFISIVLIVGALRHPEIAPSGRQVGGTPEEQLQLTMLMVALIIFPRLIWWWLAGFFGGRR